MDFRPLLGDHHFAGPLPQFVVTALGVGLGLFPQTADVIRVHVEVVPQLPQVKILDVFLAAELGRGANKRGPMNGTGLIVDGVGALR